MRATVALDDELVRQAQEFSGVTERTALLREALKALIHQEASRRLAELGEALTLLFPLYFKLADGFKTYGSTFSLFFLILAYAFLVAQVTVLGFAVVVSVEQGRRPPTPRPRWRISNRASGPVTERAERAVAAGAADQAAGQGVAFVVPSPRPDCRPGRPPPWCG